MRLKMMLVAGALMAGPAAAYDTQTYLVLIAGAAGEPKYEERFSAWSSMLAEAARERYGVPDSATIWVGGRRGNAELPYSAATKADIDRALRELAARAEADARVVVVLFGHGSAVGGESRFNVPGPDLSAREFAGLLDLFTSQEIVFINLTSASGGFIADLSGPRRTIITATKSGFERNETVFGGYFVEALAGTGADVDKDERVSMLEAFTYAKREVARAYEQDERLLTEHALLDDDGDGEGSGEPAAGARDGSQAARLFLGDGGAVVAGAVTNPELQRLYRERQQLEEQLARLRAAKDGMRAAEYEAELERILLELARVGQAIRAREGGSP